MIFKDRDGYFCLWAPTDVLDISHDWSQWLAQEGATTIDSSTWTSPEAFPELSSTTAEAITAALFDGTAAEAGDVLTIENTITAGTKTCTRGMRVKVVPSWQLP